MHFENGAGKMIEFTEEECKLLAAYRNVAAMECTGTETFSDEVVDEVDRKLAKVARLYRGKYDTDR